MPADLQSIADPRLVVLAWSAGLALVAGVVSVARIVGPGFTWLTAGISILVGLASAFGGSAWWARFAVGLLVLGLFIGRHQLFAGVLFLIGGVAMAFQASVMSGWIPAATATLALGGVTGEMVLGHWYLVDPRLPRAALRNLAIAGIVGLVADSLVLAAAGLGGGGAAVAFWVLAISSVALMVAVIASLRHPAYSGVMAATGLAYLAVLTSLGAVFLGRALVAGIGPFVS